MGPTVWIERLERIGRLILWLVLAAAVLLVPIEYIKQRRLEAGLREAVRKEDLQRAREEKAKTDKSDRLSFKTLQPSLMALDNATGRLWFTNVSSRSGVVCVVGVATNPNTKQTSESLPACKAVTAYASNVELSVMFAGGEIRPMCKDVTCAVDFKEAPDAPEVK